MRFINSASLGLLACRVLAVLAQAEQIVNPEDTQSDAASPNLAVKADASFPAASEIFGVKLVNGQPTEAVVTFKNQEKEPVTVAMIGGGLWTLDSAGSSSKKEAASVMVREIRGTPYNLEIPAESSESASFSFSTTHLPQDLRLELIALVTSAKGGVYKIPAFNSTVSVVEPDQSIFDPQMLFLYIILGGVFAGSVIFIYNTWIMTIFPQMGKDGKGGERAKKSTHGAKKVNPNHQVLEGDADGPAVVNENFDPNWIPQHHISRPEAKRMKSGGGKPKKA